ncbi:MAG: hypothetical protein NZM12_02300, partial [Steroidobacteraceae bacterium]|nr:hypothetical protein [Steroidobacteraceae bacterium]
MNHSALPAHARRRRSFAALPALVALAWAVCEAAPDAADGAAATDPPRFDIEVSDAPARPFFLGLA